MPAGARDVHNRLMTTPVPQGAFSDVAPVEDRHRFDEAALGVWLEANIEGYGGPLEVKRFKGGQSNPTFLLITPAKRYVMRKKPGGKLLPSAHAVDREYRLLSALYPTGFPLARAYALCTDESVVGAMFYIMDHVEGRILWDGALPGFTPEARRALYLEQIATLARLHAIDPASVGLSDYGKPGNYFARQIDRWSKQYKLSETEAIPEMDALIAWLPATIPAGERVSIVHGDFRLDNMIADARAPRILAVLDWELSTLGDPLGDFTYFLMNWVIAPDGRAGIAGLDLAALGIPTIEDTVAEYCRRTGRDGVDNLDWYFAYNAFRLAAILQGIAGRIREGTAASAEAVQTVKQLPALVHVAYTHARKAGMP